MYNCCREGVGHAKYIMSLDICRSEVHCSYSVTVPVIVLTDNMIRYRIATITIDAANDLVMWSGVRSVFVRSSQLS